MKTYYCPLGSCDFTLAGVNIDDGIDEHEAGHIARIDGLEITQLAEADLREGRSTAGGLRITLDQLDTFGRFGELQDTELILTFDKAHGSDDLPGLDPARIPELISELQRLHGIWKRQTDD